METATVITVRMNVLPIGSDDDEEDDYHAGRHPRCVVVVGQATEGEDEQNLLRRVSVGREGVAGEDWECDPLGEQRLAQLGARLRTAY
jgi:hypothetical protein